MSHFTLLSNLLAIIAAKVKSCGRNAATTIGKMTVHEIKEKLVIVIIIATGNKLLKTQN